MRLSYTTQLVKNSGKSHKKLNFRNPSLFKSRKQTKLTITTKGTIDNVTTTVTTTTTTTTKNKKKKPLTALIKQSSEPLYRSGLFIILVLMTSAGVPSEAAIKPEHTLEKKFRLEKLNVLNMIQNV